MPGLSAIHGPLADDDDVAAALDSLCFLDDYRVRIELDDGRTTIGQTGYEDYPVRRLETDHGTVFLEGHLYDVADVNAQLRRVAALIADGDTAALADWVNSRDGDFLVVLRDDDGIAVLNDPLARLPVYYGTVDGSVVVSRELKFPRELARRRGRPLELDRLGVGQRLLFGYPLGDRTLFDDVRTLPPYSLLRVTDGEVRIQSIDDHDFTTVDHRDRSIEENARAIAARITRACENRSLGGRQSVISMSGGLDSRTLAAAYATGGIPATTASFETADGGNATDVRIAGRVANELGLDWRTYRAAASEEHEEALLEMKQGLNFVGMAYILDFFEQLRADFGSPVYVTGDGGDKILVDLTPTTNPGTIDELVDYVIDTNSEVPLADAAAVAGVDAQSIRDSVERRLRSYPESDLDRAYVHFLIRERGVNYLTHGEDRNRYYFWSVAPFYAMPLFRYAMNCPDDQKEFRELSAAVFDHLDPAMVEIEYPNFGAPITSLEYRVKRTAYDLFGRYPDVRDRVLDLVLSRSTDTDDLAAAIRRQVRTVDATRLSGDGLADVLRRQEAYSRPAMEELYTVSSLAAGLAAERAPKETEVSASRPQ